jgi:hypothetical protein
MPTFELKKLFKEVPQILEADGYIEELKTTI